MADPLDLASAPTRTVKGPHGVTLAYVSLGEGPRTLLLANGLGGRLYAWEPLVRAVLPAYRVITWDYRGLFDSGSPALLHRLGVREHAEDALAILDQEGVRSAVFCGWSMGVQVSLEVAALFPERVAGLVLMNGSYGHIFASGLQPLVRLPFASAWGHAIIDHLLDHPEFTRYLAYGARRASTPLLVLFWLLTGAPVARLRPLVRRYVHEIFDPRTFPNYLRLFEELDAHSVYHHLHDVRAPTLVVDGAWDILTPAYLSREMARRIHGAERVHVRRGTHFVLLEHPDVVVPAIQRFLARRARWAVEGPGAWSPAPGREARLTGNGAGAHR